MKYDQNYVDSFKDRAMTKSSDFVEGQTYYGSYEGKGFIFIKNMTNQEAYQLLNMDYYPEEKRDEIHWLYIKKPGYLHNNEDYFGTESHADRNLDDKGGYNPWLIFADEATAKEYYEGLKITYTNNTPEFDECEMNQYEY